MAVTITQSASGVLLTLADLAKWEKEYDDLRAHREAIDMQLDELSEIIGLTKELIAKIRPRPAPARLETPTAPKEADLPLTDLIYAIIERMNGAATNEAIKKALYADTTQAERLKRSPNYFYTAMKRLKDREMIVANGERFRIAANEINPPPRSHQLSLDGAQSAFLSKNPATEVAGS